MDLSKISDIFTLNVGYNFTKSANWYEPCNIPFQPDFCIVRCLQYNDTNDGLCVLIESDINASTSLGIAIDCLSYNNPNSIIKVTKNMMGNSTINFNVTHNEPQHQPISINGGELFAASLEFKKLK